MNPRARLTLKATTNFILLNILLHLLKFLQGFSYSIILYFKSNANKNKWWFCRFFMSICSLL
jgi:hypothetical protein